MYSHTTATEDVPSAVAIGVEVPHMPNRATDRGVTIVGVPLDNVTMEQAVQRVDSYIREGGFHQIATANVNFLVNSLRYPELQNILGSCDMVVPDGMPLLWISRAMHQPLRERVTGVDMIPHLARLSAEKGYGIYLLGAIESSSAATCVRAAGSSK